MMRRANSLMVGDVLTSHHGAVVVAIEPLNEDMQRVTLFVDGEVHQRDMGHEVMVVATPPKMLLEALQALSNLREVCDTLIHAPTTGAERQAVELLSEAKRAGIMQRYGGVYSVRK